MKGVILAGGSGTRLYPLTFFTNKHLLPVYNRQLILYPFQTLINAGVKDILIICSKEYVLDFSRIFASGRNYKAEVYFRIQEEPTNLPDAILNANKFIDEDFICILGDSLYTNNLNLTKKKSAKIFCKYMDKDVNQYGVFKNLEIIEKPKDIDSGFAVTGCYMYPKEVMDVISENKFTNISEVNNFYLNKNELDIDYFDEYEWWDVGTIDRLYEASEYIKNRNRELILEIPSFKGGILNAIE